MESPTPVAIAACGRKICRQIRHVICLLKLRSEYVKLSFCLSITRLSFRFRTLLSTPIYLPYAIRPGGFAIMKTWSSALAAFALASFATALVSAPARALQRRTDVPPLAPCPSNDYKPYTYVGCFFEDNPTALQFSSNLVFGEMTVETCTATCKVYIKP